MHKLERRGRRKEREKGKNLIEYDKFWITKAKNKKGRKKKRI